MIEKLQAVGVHIIIQRDVPESEKNGLSIPDQAKKKPATGKILSVGGLVIDKNVKVGKTAVFNQHAGFEIEIQNELVWVINDAQIIGVL